MTRRCNGWKNCAGTTRRKDKSPECMRVGGQEKDGGGEAGGVN
ncbi:MAG: hypothetical protein ACYTEQ_20495 [Planctomycetota bacterium]